MTYALLVTVWFTVGLSIQNDNGCNNSTETASVERACINESSDDFCVVVGTNEGGLRKEQIKIVSQTGEEECCLDVDTRVGGITFQANGKALFYSTLSRSEDGTPHSCLFRWDYTKRNKPEEITSFSADGIMAVMYQKKTDSVWVSLASGSLVSIPPDSKNLSGVTYKCPNAETLVPVCNMWDDYILVHEIVQVIVPSKWSYWPWPDQVYTQYSFAMLNTASNNYDIQKRFSETTHGTNASHAWMNNKGKSIIILDCLARTIKSYNVLNKEQASPEYNIAYQTKEGRDVIKEIVGWVASPETWPGICVLSAFDTSDTLKYYLVDMRSGFSVQEYRTDVGTPIIVGNGAAHIVSYTLFKEKLLFHSIPFVAKPVQIESR